MRDLGLFFLRAATEVAWQGCRQACHVQHPRSARQCSLKNTPFVLMPSSQTIPSPSPAHPAVTLEEQILPGMADASSPPDKKYIKVNVHDSRGRLTVINTRKMSQDIEEVMD